MAQPWSDGLIHGYYNTRGDVVLVNEGEDAPPGPGWTEVSWNQVGPQGPQGPPGTTGGYSNVVSPFTKVQWNLSYTAQEGVSEGYAYSSGILEETAGNYLVVPLWCSIWLPSGGLPPAESEIRFYNGNSDEPLIASRVDQMGARTESHTVKSGLQVYDSDQTIRCEFSGNVETFPSFNAAIMFDYAEVSTWPPDQTWEGIASTWKSPLPWFSDAFGS